MRFEKISKSVLLTIFLCTLISCAEGNDPTFIDIPAETMAPFQKANTEFGNAKTVSTGSKVAITGIQGSLAVGAGYEVLKKGGNAIDAALTTALAQTAVQGGYGMSYAGFLTMTYYEAATGRIYTLNAGYNTPLNEDDPMGIPTIDKSNGRGIMVPGFMAGVEAAHEKFGSVDFADLFTPAIQIAENGVYTQSRLSGIIESRKPFLENMPGWREKFQKADGTFYTQGDIFTQPALAQTLKKVATEGAEYMYSGEWAQKYIQAVQEHEGKMTLKDLARYEPIWSEALATEYGGLTVATLPAPNYGGMALIELLNLMEASGLSEAEHYAKDPESLANFIKLSRVNKLIPEAIMGGEVKPSTIQKYLGDLDNSSKNRATKEWAQQLWTLIDSEKWTAFENNLVEDVIESRAALAAVHNLLKGIEEDQNTHKNAANKPQNSDCVIVSDAQGNIASILHTFNGMTWGFGLVVDGVTIPDSGVFQQLQIAATGPGNRLGDPTLPTIYTKDGKPVMATCSVGSWLPATAAMHLNNIIDHGMEPEESYQMPRFWRMDTDKDRLIQHIPEGKFDAVLVKQLKKRDVHTKSANIHYGMTSYINAITLNPETGKKKAVTSPVFNGATAAH